MLDLLKRHREFLLVVVLLLVPLGVFFSHAKRPGERGRIDRVVLAVTYPVEKAVGWAVTGALEAWRGYVALRGVREEAVRLRREVEALERERLELAELGAENERLRSLLAFAREEPELKLLGARVVGVRFDPKGLQLLVLDRGARDGLVPLMPVVTSKGVVGRLHAVFRGTAEVLALTDRNSSVAVRVERSRTRANVRGLGHPDGCRLDYALRSEELLEGDTLVTSGTDGIFPRGLRVGQVTRVKRPPFGLYQTADVVPAVNVTRVEEVLVVASPRPAAESGPAARAP